ncbi:MAG: exo-alpha-sialidase [Bacteroidaceae bacterium]|nr:exo-alpha-sialidase [Bacteroidaceae bacterium]
MKTNRIFLAMLAMLLGVTTSAWGQQENAASVFSSSFKKGKPVQITNNRDKGFSIKFNDKNNIAGEAVKSGATSYTTEDIWYLVGNAENFKMYSHVAGSKYALKLDGTESGVAATMVPEKEATVLTLTKQEDNSYAISPKANPSVSFNMFGGAGRDIKLYASEDGGSHWNLKVLDMSRPLKLKYNALLNGGFDTNYKIGNIAITIDGNTSNTLLDKNSLPESTTCYLPKDAKFSIATGLVCHGWKMDINGGKSMTDHTLPEKGMEVTVNISVDKNNKYQYLYYSPDEKGIPYRIPAIVSTANGYVFAINDYRPCGNDIGFGEVDLVMRHSTKAGTEWDGHSWTDPVTIADGVGKEAKETWLTGFGDPAIVADRERNEILVMSVCGNRLCWHGNYGAGTSENPENPNRMARLRIKFNEETQQWETTQPEEVTYEIYPLFKDKNGKAHVGSMFIGAGRMAQSSMIKVGDYYRIYCAVWAVETGSYRHHNYVLYSDDFGDTWNLLGELGNDFNDSPAPFGNEPKCEELPDGSVLLSSRKGYGRYYNVFHYSNFEKAEGRWDGAVATDEVGNLKFGRNDTNGEVLRIGNTLFQSVPTGDSRSDVAIYYRPLSDDPATYTPKELANGWKKFKVSDRGSAYSSICILPDGKSIGIYYEEEPGGYSMVYRPIELSEITENDK